MKLIDRHELMKMPKGTVYMSFYPAILGPLMVKGDTTELRPGESCDWFENALGPDIFIAGSGDHDQFELNSDICREACFNDDTRYLMLEQPDIDIMVAKLQGTYDGEATSELRF